MAYQPGFKSDNDPFNKKTLIDAGNRLHKIESGRHNLFIKLFSFVGTQRKLLRQVIFSQNGAFSNFEIQSIQSSLMKSTRIKISFLF